MKVQTDRGATFDAYQWPGLGAERPEWLAHNEETDHKHYGPVLHVGDYMVRPGRWVLRSHDPERSDIFPVPADMFDAHYTQVEGQEL